MPAQKIYSLDSEHCMCIWYMYVSLVFHPLMPKSVN